MTPHNTHMSHDWKRTKWIGGGYWIFCQFVEEIESNETEQEHVSKSKLIDDGFSSFIFFGYWKIKIRKLAISKYDIFCELNANFFTQLVNWPGSKGKPMSCWSANYVFFSVWFAYYYHCCAVCLVVDICLFEMHTNKMTPLTEWAAFTVHAYPHTNLQVNID